MAHPDPPAWFQPHGGKTWFRAGCLSGPDGVQSDALPDSLPGPLYDLLPATGSLHSMNNVLRTYRTHKGATGALRAAWAALTEADRDAIALVTDARRLAAGL